MFFICKRLSILMAFSQLLVKWSAAIISVVPWKKSQDSSLPQRGPDFQFSAQTTSHFFFCLTPCLSTPPNARTQLEHCDLPALEASPRFLCPWYCFRMLGTFTFFPFIKSSIILWTTTRLLCAYRNKAHLSKMNRQISEDSAEAVLLSEWKLAINFMLHTSPTGITWVLGKCHHFLCKRHRSFFSVTEVKPTTFIFFFFKAFILEQLFFMHPLKALPQDHHSWETQTESTCLQSYPAQINNILNNLKSGKNFKQMYK